MRYITVPSPFNLIDAIEDKPLEGAEAFPFAKFVRVLTSNAAAQQAADTLTLVDIRTAADALKAGDTWELTDEWYEILKREAVRIKGAQPAFVFSSASHVRAIVSATSTKPAPLA